MTEVILRPKGSIDIMVEAEVINPDVFAGKTTSEIEQLIVWQGAKQLALSGFFDVEGSAGSTAADTKIIVQGDVPRVKHIGHGMKAGEIVIEGSSGMHVGSEMIGGSIFVKGDAGSWAGMEMKGGTLHIIGKIKQFSPGFEYAGTEKNPKVGETVQSGEFMKFAGDYAISKTPKGILYASKEANEEV